MSQYEYLNQYDYTRQCGGTVTRLYEIKAVRAIDAHRYMGANIIMGGAMRPITVVNRSFPNSIGLPRVGVEINGMEFPEDAAILVAIERPEPKPVVKPVDMSDIDILKRARDLAQERFGEAECGSDEEDIWNVLLAVIASTIERLK